MNNAQQVSFHRMLAYALDETVRQEWETIPKDGSLNLSGLDERIRKSVAQLKKALVHKKQTRLRILKKTLLTAAVLASLLFATLMTNASVRNAVVNTIIEWTGRDVGIRFEIEGEPLAALPENYGPHYIPEGFVFLEEVSFKESDGSFSYGYQTEDGSNVLDIQVGIAQNGSMYWMDNEHTIYDKITFNGVSAYLGTFQKHKGYVMLWAKDGVEYYIYTEGTMSLSDVYKIAENIY